MNSLVNPLHKDKIIHLLKTRCKKLSEDRGISSISRLMTTEPLPMYNFAIKGFFI